MSVVNAIPLIAAGDDGYSISRSLRFRSSASASLTRTPATASNRKTWTWSGWVKLGSLSGTQGLFDAFLANNFTETTFRYTSNTLNFFSYVSSYLINVSTTAVFRDPSAWYHIILSVDTTQATNSNGVKIWVNGVQQTLTFSAYTQDHSTYVNNTNTHYIATNYDGNYFDGYLAEVNFIDGQALTPSSFGEYNLYGQWVPKKYAGSYGTNGFYLNFNDNSAATATTIGKDSSGLGNNWTPNNISVTAGSTYDSMKDVPTLTSATAANFCVLSPIGGVPSPIAGYTTSTITNGNLTAAYGGGTIAGCVSTIPINVSGSWYWEATLTAVTSDLMITPSGYQTSSRLGLEISLYLGRIVSDGSVVQSGLATGSNGDVIGIAYNSSTRTATITKNNAAWATQAVSTTANAYFLYAGVEDYSSVLRHNASFNFGQRPFTYTPPTGYLALNTFNL